LANGDDGVAGETMVRVAETADAPAFAAIYAPIVTDTVISFETEPPSPEEMAGRIARTLADYPWLAAVRDGQVAGYAYASQHRSRAAYRWSVDVTVYVAEPARRCGVGAVLYTALNDILRRQGFRSAFAGIALPNPGSIGLHEAMGFEPVGVYRDVGFKLGAWRDVGWWRLGLSAGDETPIEPVAFRDLADPIGALPRP
jgi:L-amino acid N-acyltransferase YncA